MTEVERLCVEAATAGTVADLIALPEEDRNLTPVFLRTLLRARDPEKPAEKLDVDPLGVRIKGLIVKEPLDLSRLNVPFPIELTHATFEGPVSLASAKVRAICFDGSTFKAHCDAEGIEVGADFSAQDAKFDDWLSLTAAGIGGSLLLSDARLAAKTPVHRQKEPQPTQSAFVGDGMNVRGDVFFATRLRNTYFRADGEVRLVGATIGGNWICIGATFNNPSGSALYADRATVGGNVLFRAYPGSTRFRAIGSVRIQGASIGGNWECDGGSFHVKSGNALLADHIRVEGSVFFRSPSPGPRFEAVGSVRICSATIGGNWECTGSSFKTPGGVALGADSARVAGHVFFRSDPDGFRFESLGVVRLVGCNIGGNWDCSGASLKNSKGVALLAEAVEVASCVFFRTSSQTVRFEVEGASLLSGAKIHGDWECDGGAFKNGGGDALCADMIEVGGRVSFCAQPGLMRFEAEGQVCLRNARILANLDCSGASFQNDRADAFNGDGVQIGGSVYFRARTKKLPFQSIGRIRLLGARISGILSCIGCSLVNPNGDALGGDGMEVGGSLFFRGADTGISIQGTVNLVSAKVGQHFQWLGVEGAPGVVLAQAQVGTLNIDPPEDGANWQLNGFRYEGFADPAKSSGELMLKLLRASDGGAYFPQPYRQLFRTLRDAGHAREAKDVAIAMRKAAFDSEQARLLRASGRPSCWKKLKRWRRMMEWYSRRALKHKSPFEFRATNSQRSGIELKAMEAGSSPPIPTKGLVLKLKARVALKLIKIGIKQLPSETVDSIRVFWGVSGVAIKKCFSWIVGYGYIPSRVFWLSLGIVLGASSICAGAVIGNFLSLLDPVDGGRLDALQVNPSHKWGDDSPKFIVLIYVLDRFLPIVDLGQASAFRPKDIGLLILDWVLIGSGWILTTLLVGTVSGLMRRIDSDQ